VLLRPTILASLPGGKPQRDYLEALLTLLVGLPVRPTHRNLARFGEHCAHTHGRQAARAYDFAALNLAGLCAVVPYAHDLAWAGDSTCLPKSGRKLPGVGWRWHSGEGRVAWGQQLELLSVLDLEEHCSYPVHARLQPAQGARTRRAARRSPGPPRAEVAVMLELLDQALAVDHRPDIGVFVGDGHYGCAPMVEGLRARDLHLVGKLRRNAVLWVPWTAPPTGRPGRPRKYAGRFDRARIPELPAVDLEDEGQRLYHAQLYYKPFQLLLRVVFVLDIDADPEQARPVTLFATDPEMAPARIYRIYRDRFQIEFNFRDAKQHLGLTACQARTADRHHFHGNAVLAALAWTRLELRHAADQALERFSMANVKLKSFLKLVLQRLFDTDGLGRTLPKYPEALQALLDLGPSEPQPP
jgi:hypothetical protein